MGSTEPRLKVVLDTNVVVSALLFRGPLRVFQQLWSAGAFSWLVSAEILQEYSRVLANPKFALEDRVLFHALHRGILPHITPVAVVEVPPVIKADPTDDKFLACAVAGRADVLVSGDRHLLTLKKHHGIPILTPREFLHKHLF